MAGRANSRTTTKASGRRSPSSPKGTFEVTNGVSHDRIAMRAYEIYLSRGAVHGRDIEDWLQAEQEVVIK
jgi:hypothetical protein